MILEPGTFRTRDYRKAIPVAIARAVFARHVLLYGALDMTKRYEIDHDPALTNRPYDTDAGDFIPPQHSLAHLVLREEADHDEKTFGRKAGAAKTVTTRGSDVGERARTRDIRKSEAAHREAIAAKGAGARVVRARKASIPSRGFDPGRRPLRSRNTFKRGQP